MRKKENFGKQSDGLWTLRPDRQIDMQAVRNCESKSVHIVEKLKQSNP